jgi:hypothetical protein
MDKLRTPDARFANLPGLFQEHVPGAEGCKHRVFPKGTHFIREREPGALVEVIGEVAR